MADSIGSTAGNESRGNKELCLCPAGLCALTYTRSYIRVREKILREKRGKKAGAKRLTAAATLPRAEREEATWSRSNEN